MKLPELQELDKEVQGIRVIGELQDRYKEIDGVLQYQGLPFVSEIIWIKFFSWHHNNPLVDHFGVNKIRELIGQKYYWPSLRKDIKSYIKGYDICLSLKTMSHKSYSNFQ